MLTGGGILLAGPPWRETPSQTRHGGQHAILLFRKASQVPRRHFLRHPPSSTCALSHDQTTLSGPSRAALRSPHLARDQRELKAQPSFTDEQPCSRPVVAGRWCSRTVGAGDTFLYRSQSDVTTFAQVNSVQHRQNVKRISTLPHLLLTSLSSEAYPLRTCSPRVDHRSCIVGARWGN